MAATASAAVVALGFSVTPAHAATASPYADPANGASRSEAGYALGSAPATSSASTTFLVPSLACPASGLLGVAPGAFIFTRSGSTANVSGASVFIVCQNGTTFYQAETIVNGKITALPVTARRGDKVITTVSVSATKVSVTLNDATRHVSYTRTGSGTPPVQELDGIDSPNSGPTQLGVPNFGSLIFSSSSIDGKTLRAAAAKPIDRRSATHLEVTTGTLDATGTRFTETFRHA
jgi:hypothetical protein